MDWIPDSSKGDLDPQRRWRVNLLAPPLIVLVAWLVVQSPLAFLLSGFQVWVHEFGHALVCWLTGRRAFPLPFGWTSIESEFSWVVYASVLFLLGVFFTAGWRERKIWPMVMAVALAGLQFWMTWCWPEARQQFWVSFSGVAGEFILNTLAMMLFFADLPAKFRWRECRYVFLFLGAACFLPSLTLWHRVNLGLEPLPLGSLLFGEEDAGGDMNVLMDDFGWSCTRIQKTYYLLAVWCVWATVCVYLLAACRAGRGMGWLRNRFGARGE